MDSQTLPTISEFFRHIGDYMPKLLAGLVVFLLGLLVAWIGAKLIVRLLILSRLDRVLIRTGWVRALDKGDVRHSLFAFIGWLFGGVIFLIFLDNAIVIWGLTVLSEMLERFVLLVPRLIASIIIMLVGWGLATGVSKSVRRTLYQEEFDRARLVGRIVFAAIIVLTTAIALVQLDIAVGIVTGAFFIAFGAIGLGFVLAFGLGSRSAVETMWKEKIGARTKRLLGESADDADGDAEDQDEESGDSEARRG